jgi:CRP-like cAMP-binding protein
MLYEPLVKKLASVEALSDIEVQAAISLCTETRIVRRKQDVISDGDTPERVHLVLRGWAARYKILEDGSRRVLAFLLPGDFCDTHITTLAAMDHGIMAITDCDVAFIEKERIDDITRSTSTLTRAFWRATLIDEAILRQWLVNSGRRDAYQAIAHLMCELHLRMRIVGLASNDRLELPLTQEIIADAIGATSVHVNRMLQRLRADGLIVIGNGELRIPDVQKLRRTSGFDPSYLHLEARTEPVR